MIDQQRSRERTFKHLLSLLLCLFSEKDVNRTDRTNRFYEGIDNPGLVLLHDILMTYCMYDFDLGEMVLFITVLLFCKPQGPESVSCYLLF